MKLGVITDCFRTGLTEAIEAAVKLGLDGVQIYATGGEFSPEQLDEQSKKHFAELLRNNHLTVSALCGDLGGYGFQIAEDNLGRIEKTKRIVDLAAEFGAPVVTTHIGVIPADRTAKRYRVMLDALTECGRYAKQKGITLAIETGPEKAKVLLQFIEDTDGGVGVNLDPANFVMVTDQDPVEAVYLLRNYIVHTHLKDGIMLRQEDPEKIYDCFAKGGIEELNVSDYFLETPLGEGRVDFPHYLAALKEIGYNGFLTIERETGADPAADIRHAVQYIRHISEQCI